MDAFIKDFGLQGLAITLAIFMSILANRRIRALELHDEDQDLDLLELVFEMYESKLVPQDFVHSFIQRKRGGDHSSKSALGDLLESVLM